MACLHAADILLPADEIDMKKWSVIACDQFTSQPEYWQQVEAYVGDAPSTLRLIYPEVYLDNDDERTYGQRIDEIRANMNRYLTGQVLTERVHQGYVLTVRTTKTGMRLGLVAVLDLETYDYAKGTKAPVRATEETVPSRIPVRVGIRKDALVESPHVMMLMDDEKYGILESLYKEIEKFRKLYDLELMLEGGHLCGYAIEGEAADALTRRLLEAEQGASGMFLAVGDGNHSLAAAKTCWELVKKNLREEDWENHPARYSLVEVVNLHSPSLCFEAIHRVVYGGEREVLIKEFQEYLEPQGIGCRVCLEKEEAADVIFVQNMQRVGWRFIDAKRCLAVDVLQHFLDEYLQRYPQVRIDYVHSEQAVVQLSKERKVCGILLGAIDKSDLFSAIQVNGVLPRKTFSIGEPVQKRYYMECRSLVE